MFHAPVQASAAPFFADDNREPAISDNGSFWRLFPREISRPGNADANPELFFYNVGTDAFTQATNTQDATPGVGLVFQSNPSLSSDGSRVAFFSSANLATNNADGNAEVYTATFSGSSVGNVFQVTRTQNNVVGAISANFYQPGRRLSRDGAFIAFESRATDPKSGAAVATNTARGLFVYTVASDTFVEIGTRTVGFDDLIRFPAFTDYNGTLSPSSLVFVSNVNYRVDGTLPPTAQASEGLNPFNQTQFYLTQIPASSSNTFIRLTNTSRCQFRFRWRAANRK